MGLELEGVQFLAAVGVGLGGAALISLLILVWYVALLTTDLAKHKTALNSIVDEHGKVRPQALSLGEYNQALEENQKSIEQLQSKQKEIERLDWSVHELMEKVLKLEAKLSEAKLSMQAEQAASVFEKAAPKALPAASPSKIRAAQKAAQVENATPADGPSSGDGSSPNSEGVETASPVNENWKSNKPIAADSSIVMVQADIGFREARNQYQPAKLEQPQSVWPPTPPNPPRRDRDNYRVVPLLPVQNAQNLRQSDDTTLSDSIMESEASPSDGNISVSTAPQPPLRSPTPGNSTSRSKRQAAYGGLPLSARGIDPQKHPELHAKEMAEMRKLLTAHCSDSAVVMTRTSIQCQWCKNSFTCPPYRPQSFFFKDIHNGGEHDGHFWTCTTNPNNSLQAGKGIPIGLGKVLI